MGENGSFQGLWIPREILLLPISIMQKVLLAEIMALSQRKGVCFASNKYLADFIHTSPDTVKRCLAGLKEAGYISITGPTCTRKICICTSNLVQKCTTLGAESPELGAKMHHDEHSYLVQNAPDLVQNRPNLVQKCTTLGAESPELGAKMHLIEYREYKENIGENIAGGSGNPDSAPPNIQPNTKNQNKGDVSSILGEPEDIQTCTERESEWTRERALKYAQVRWQSIQGLDITPFQADFIARQLLKFGKLWVDKAFEELLFKGNEIQGNKFSYLRRMLESWEESGSKEPWKSRLRAKESGQSNGMAVQPQSTGDGFAVFGKSGSYGNSKLDICRQVYEMAGGMDGDDE